MPSSRPCVATTLGRVIWDGAAALNTGVPGTVGGQSELRILRAEASGPVSWLVDFGDHVVREQAIGAVGDRSVRALTNGVVRGLIAPGSLVTPGLKIGDIDPSGDAEACWTYLRQVDGGWRGRARGGAGTPQLAVTESLASQLGVGDRALVSFVGAGGKSTLLFRLGNELAAAGCQGGADDYDQDGQRSGEARASRVQRQTTLLLPWNGRGP